MRSLFFLFALISIFKLAYSQEEGFKEMDDPSMLKDGLLEMSKETQTISAEFVQEKNMEILSSVLVSRGSINFKAPDKLRWEYKEPFQYLIVLSDQKMYIKDEEKTNTFDLESSATFREINQLIISSVQGNLLDDSRFEIAYFSSADAYKTILKTKSSKMKQVIAEIVLLFDKNNFDLSQVKLIEPSGDYTNLIFKNRVLNKPIDDSLFLVN